MSSEDEQWTATTISDHYEVSDRGRIRLAANGEIKHPTITRGGSSVINLRIGATWRVRSLSAVVAQTFLGPRPSGHMVVHRDGNRTNCAVDNLRYVSLGKREPNDPHERGRYLVGKLDEFRARAIRIRALRGESGRDLAEEYGVSAPLVSEIKNGLKWRLNKELTRRDRMIGPKCESKALVTLLDPELSRRSAVTRLLNNDLMKVVPYERLEQLLANWPRGGLVAVADTGTLVGELQEAMRTTHDWRSHVVFGENPAPSAIVDAIIGGATDYFCWPCSPGGLAERMQLWRARSEPILRRIELKKRAHAKLLKLTKREAQVLALSVEGLTYAEIAQALDLSPRTVEIHRYSMLKKLDEKRIAGAIKMLLHADL